MKALLKSLVPTAQRAMIARMRLDFDRWRIAATLPRPSLRWGAVEPNAAVVFGLHRASIGIGRSAVLLARELEADGLAVQRIDTTEILALPSDSPEPMDEEVGSNAPLILALNPDVLAHALARYGPDVLRHRRVIGYWVYELERAPAAWRALRDIVHEIWAPSTFAASALEATLGRPVRVVPHPVALCPPAPQTINSTVALRARFGVAPDGFLAFFTFSASSSPARKNPHGLIRAFRDAFSGRRDAKLVIRALHVDRHPGVLDGIQALVREAQGQVVLLDRDGMTASQGIAERDALYAACDAYVSLHRSEGFGLTLAEAMLAGRAVVATNWSGNTDFMDASSATLVPARLVPVAEPMGLYGGRNARWADPDHDAAVEALRALAADPDKRALLAAKGRARAMNDLAGGVAVARLRRPQ